jgi:hypothetical protein
VLLIRCDTRVRYGTGENYVSNQVAGR